MPGRADARRSPSCGCCSAPGAWSPPWLRVLLLLFGLAFPLGWLDAPDHGHLLAMVRNPITKLVVLVLVVLALFHAAHRFRFVLDHGLQLGRFDRVIALWCYGMAVLGSATAGWMLLTM